MIEYKEEQKTVRVRARISCNKCGKSFDYDGSGYPHPDAPSFTNIECWYGFGSTKDGDLYVSHVCAPCMDEIYASFAVPPQISETIIWGEKPALPERLVNEPKISDV